MNRLRTTITTAAALTTLPATTAAGCGSDGQPHAGRTLVVPGSGAPVSCTQVPYDYSLSSQEPTGNGISVIHGIVRGSMWVACTGVPKTFEITVRILSGGLPVGNGSSYGGIPNSYGYEAWTIVDCTPGVYRLQYDYKWSALGGVEQDLNTVGANREVSQHDCDES